MRKYSLIFAILFLFSCNVKTEVAQDQRYDSVGNSEVASMDLTRYTIDNLFNVADANFKIMAYYDAIECLNEIIKRDSLQGAAYFMRARCYNGIDEGDKSNDDYRKAIVLSYRISDSYYNMGLNYAVSNNDSATLACFKEVLKRNPNDSMAKFYVDQIEKGIGKSKKEKTQI